VFDVVGVQAQTANDSNVDGAELLQHEVVVMAGVK